VLLTSKPSSPGASPPSHLLQQQHAKGSSGSGSSSSNNIREFAPVDPELYPLRMPSAFALESDRHPRRLLKNLAFRSGGGLLRQVRRAARLGSRNGNRGSGARALVALEDFFVRHHHAMLSSDPDLVVRSLETMRDDRTTALNALQDLTMTLPYAEPVRRACEAAREETQRCMAALADRHDRHPSGSPSLSAAAAALNARDPLWDRSNLLY
jgi:hypothetical protein